MYEVRLTETAFQCLADIESFKTATIGSVDAGHFVDQLLLEATATLREDPKRYRFNATLADYGLALQERLDKHEYRTLYEITGHTVDILLFLHTRQDLTRALRRHMLLS